ncbi:hypothetical protein PTKIN_Ptkin02bG0013900 [Pterospermum kingtungense]
MAAAATSLWLSDEMVAALTPIIVYWVYLGMYMVLGSSFDDYRLHSNEEEDEMNLVSRGTVNKCVLFQQSLQLVVVLLLLLV